MRGLTPGAGNMDSEQNSMADFDTINENEPAESGPEMQKKEVDLRFSGVIRDAWMCYREGILKLLLMRFLLMMKVI